MSRGTCVQVTANVFDMVKMVMRACKYRFYPTPGQAAESCRTFGCIRKVWNLTLAARTTAWHQQRERITYGQSSAPLTQWKRSADLAFLPEVSAVPLQQALRHLQTAYTRYWHHQARHPVFKARKKSRASAEYTRSGFRYRDGQLYLAKMTGPLAIAWSRPLPAGENDRRGTERRIPSVIADSVHVPHAPARDADADERDEREDEDPPERERDEPAPTNQRSDGRASYFRLKPH